MSLLGKIGSVAQQVGQGVASGKGVLGGLAGKLTGNTGIAGGVLGKATGMGGPRKVSDRAMTKRSPMSRSMMGGR